MNCFMGYNPLVTKQVKVTVWVCEQDGATPVAPSNPSEGDCFIVYATDEAVLSNTPTSAKSYSNGEWKDAEGGGGGDLSTAEVTIKISPEHEGSEFGIYFTASVEPPYGYAGMFKFSDNSFNYELYTEGDDLTATLYYVGDSVDLMLNNAFESCTGNAVFNPDTYKVTISGDCTITGYVED